MNDYTSPSPQKRRGGGNGEKISQKREENKTCSGQEKKNEKGTNETTAQVSGKKTKFIKGGKTKLIMKMGEMRIQRETKKRNNQQIVKVINYSTETGK